MEKPASAISAIIADQNKLPFASQSATKRRASSDPDNALFDTDEAAAYLDLQPGTLEVWRSTKRYKLAYIKIGRKVRYRKRVLDEYLDSNTVDGGVA